MFPLTALLGLANLFFYGSDNVEAEVAANGGAVMGKLGAYPFFMHHNEYKKITKTTTAEYSHYRPIKGQQLIGDTGGYTETVNINGILVVEPIDALHPLEGYSRSRTPIRFTTLEEDLDVVIQSVTVSKSHFSIQGRHRVQSYNLQLEVIYGGLL